MISRLLVTLPVFACALHLAVPSPQAACHHNIQQQQTSTTPTIMKQIFQREQKQQHPEKTTTTKTIYLIRHAESLENVAYAGARRVQAAYASRQLPALTDITDALQLSFKMFRPAVMNAALSELGRHQVAQLHQNLERDGFWNNQNNKIDKTSSSSSLLVHSPLLRAKQTAYGARWGPDLMDNAEPPMEGDILQLPCLKEVNPVEMIKDALTAPWTKHKSIDYRIQELEQWIQSRPEDTIVVVGHSVYFKRMLNLPKAFDNCDVWEAKFASERQKLAEEKGGVNKHGLPRSWISLQRLYGYQPDQIPEVEEQ